jgi:hypothetical protein
MVLAVSSLEEDSLQLEVTDLNSGLTVSIYGHYEWPLNSDGTLNVAEHTKSHRSRMFFAGLPSDGNYSACFVKDDQTYWPVYVRTDYDNPGSTCPEFNTFTLEVPNDKSCDELITKGDMELGIEGWWATMGGLLSVNESAPGQALVLTSEYRTSWWMGPAQYLDTRCMIADANYTVTAKARFVSKTSGGPIDCDPASDMCPKIIMKIESGAHEEYDQNWHPTSKGSVVLL